MKEQIEEIKSGVTEIKVDIAEIKVDLKYHIKRTNELEDMVLPLYKARIWAQYTIIIFSAVVTVAGVISLIRSSL